MEFPQKENEKSSLRRSFKSRIVQSLGELNFEEEREPITSFVADISVTEEAATGRHNCCRDEICVSTESTSGESSIFVSIFKYSSKY